MNFKLKLSGLYSRLFVIRFSLIFQKLWWWGDREEPSKIIEMLKCNKTSSEMFLLYNCQLFSVSGEKKRAQLSQIDGLPTLEEI